MKQTIERTKKKERQRVKGNKLTDIVENERKQVSILCSALRTQIQFSIGINTK
jgi:hypothetical protein